MNKLTVRCLAWLPLCRNTLRGFVIVEVEEMRLAFHEVAVYEKNGKAYAQLPSRRWIKDGAAVIGDDGKVRYSPPLIGFVSPAVRQAFSDAVVAALLRFDPDALRCKETAA